MEFDKRFSCSICCLLIFVYYLGDIIVTTSSKLERLEDFLKALDDNFELNGEDVKAIDDAGAKLHFRKYWTDQIDGKKQEL